MRAHASVILLACAAFLLSACTRDESPVGQIAATTPAPSIDKSSAEAALRAYWATLDWYAGRFVVGRVKPQPEGQDALKGAIAPLVTATVAESFVPHRLPMRRFTGKVIASSPATDGPGAPGVDVEARLESFERVEGTLTPTPVELFDGESMGNSFRYRMTQTEDGWRVAEVWRTEPGSPPQRIR